MSGTLFVVATPIGNLDDITLRALRVLREATVIAAEDTRRTAHLLARHGISTPTTSLHEHNEHRKTAALVARLQAGDQIALVSDAGTPTISDPGGELIRAAIDAGVRVEPIPGPNAAIAALSVSGFAADSFTFLGFPPTRSKARSDWFERLANIGGVVVFYEAPHRIENTLADLARLFGERPIFVARELTKVHEQLVKCQITQALSKLNSTRGEFTVIIDLGNHASIDEFGASTHKCLDRPRAVVKSFAAQLGVPANELYKAIQKLKQIGLSTNNEDVDEPAP